MRIAIASDWFAPRRGGIEGQLFQLADGLGARGNDVDVLTSTPNAAGGSGFQIRRLGIATLPGLQLAASPSLFSSLNRELRRGYDVVHAHVSVVSPVGYAAALVARSLGLPTVVTFHSVLRQKAFLLRAVNALVNLADTPVVWTGVSALVASQVARALGTSDVGVLPNGIDLGFWRSARSKAPRASKTVTLVSAMRLQRKKRPRQLLAAFAHAASRVAVPSRLLLVGDGPARPTLERDVRELGLSGTVDMLGWLSPEALRSIYADADGFVLASTRESFGIAALEARAAGLPVVAMRDAGSSEFLIDGENALLGEDDADLVRSLARLIGDAGLRARLANHSERLERYDWSSVLVEHEATYHRAVRRAAAAAGAVGASA